MNTNNSLHEAPPEWTQPGWLDQVSAWIQDALAQEGLAVTGLIEQPHIGPGSTVLRIPTSGGVYFFKATIPLFHHEVPVTAALYRWRPDCTPAVLKIDAAKGWLLMVDGGQTLRQAFNRRGASRSAPTLQSWREILALYATLQIDLAAHVDQLLLFGSPDRRLHLLPDLYRDLLSEEEYLHIGQPDGLTVSEYKRLLAATPQVEALYTELDTYKIPMSLHHNDLHDANIFYNNGRPLFFDWGDSSISHPFFSLRTTFVIIEYSFDLDEEDPIFDKLARAYLEPWTLFASLDNLLAAFKLAKRLWALSTAIKYKTLLRQVVSLREEYAEAVPGSLQEFLEANSNL